MPWSESLYPWVIHSAIVNLLALVIGSGAVLLFRQPAWPVRMIELTVAGCLIAPWLGMIPGYRQLGAGRRAATAFDQEEAALPTSVEQMAGPSVAPSNDNLPVLPHIVMPEPVPRTADAPYHYSFALASWIIAAYALGLALGVGWWLMGLVGLVGIVRTNRPAPSRCRRILRGTIFGHG